MSEYTNYLIIKSSSENEVKRKLNDAKIRSLVSIDKDGYWFLDKYKDKANSNWVSVSAPADSGFKDGKFYHRDKFQDVCKLFNTVIWFFEEENAKDWSINLKHNDRTLSKKLYSDKNVQFTNTEKLIMEDVFENQFSSFEAFLRPESAADFLNFNGIPYEQMNDQNQMGVDDTENGNYAILTSEI